MKDGCKEWGIDEESIRVDNQKAAPTSELDLELSVEVSVESRKHLTPQVHHVATVTNRCKAAFTLPKWQLKCNPEIPNASPTLDWWTGKETEMRPKCSVGRCIDSISETIDDLGRSITSIVFLNYQ